MPQDGGCEGQCGADTELTSRRWKPLLGQKSRPLQCSDVPVDETTAGEGPRQQVGGRVLPAPRGREPLDVVGGCARVTCCSSGSLRLVKLNSWGTGVGQGLSVSPMGSLDCLWVLWGLRGPGA